MTLQKNSPFCQIFPSISLQVAGISAFPKLLGFTLSPGKQKDPGKKGEVQVMLGVLLHPEHTGVTPLPGWCHPQSLPRGTPTADRYKGVFRYIPHCSFVLCLLPGSRTATVSMVSARPIPVPGCENT